MSIQRLSIATSLVFSLMAQPSPDPMGQVRGGAQVDEQADAQGKVTADDALIAANEAYTVLDPEPEPAFDCEDPVGDEIVVCAALEEQSQFRVPSSLDDGDDSHLSWDGRAPDLGPPPCQPSATSACIRFGWAPPPVYLFDITALPEPPAGSDADKIAKGEMPAR